jgi:hypothetical protein
VTLAEQWNGRRWSVQRTPNPAGARISVLSGVACSAPSACTAVGDAVGASGKEVTLAERWDGRRWTIQPVPNPAGSKQSFLIAVACPSRSSCIAVGQTGQGMLAERWEGRRWRIQRVPMPGKAQFAFLDDVSCTATAACTAVGQSNRGTLAERWNGRRWRIQRTPNPSQGGAGLLGVACTSSKSCTAVGFSNAGTLAERWNGHRWRIQPTANPPGTQFVFLNGVGCASRQACTAVGAYQKTGEGDVRPVAERWNGTKWTVQRTPSPGGAQGDFLAGVACPRRSTCTAFGFSHGSGTPLTMAQHWNGKRWRLQRTRNPVGAAESQLNGVACPNRSACMAVGQSTKGTLAERWGGARWTIVPAPNPAGAAGSGLNGVSCTSPSVCTAVGAAFDGSGNSVGTIVQRWNGIRWRIQPNPTSASHGAFLNAVSCTSPSVCTAVGNTSSGLLAERWNGTKWSIQPVPAPGPQFGFLTGVSCTSSSRCTAVGARFDNSGNPVGTVIERWNGNAWSIRPSPTSKSPGTFLAAVSCSSATACTAVGNTASKLLAERWNGTAWSLQSTPIPPGTQGQGDFFNGVSCSSRSACTAVGLAFSPPSGFPPFTLAERWNGTSWTIQRTPQIPAVGDMSPPAVSCPARTACTAVGGYESPSPTSVTLTEQWKASGASTQSVAGPSGSPSRGLACVPPLAEALARADLVRIPSSASSRPPLNASDPSWIATPPRCAGR